MADFSRSAERFTYAGVSLTPQDALPGTGKLSWGLNIRSYEEGTITVRYGTVLDATLDSGPLHSIFRLNDVGLFGGDAANWVLGSGTALYGGAVGAGSYGSLDVELSGDPLSAVVATPVQSPRPYLYVADALTQCKVNSDLAVAPWGIPAPVAPPQAILAEVNVSYLESVSGGSTWVGYGPDAAPGPSTVIQRIDTTIAEILFDNGSTGMASVSLDDMTGVTPGATVSLGSELVIVQDVFPPMAATTIGAILYDSGSTGACSIQPTGSFFIGQIENVLPDEIRRRYFDLDQSIAPRVSVTRTVDFPVNALVELGGSEIVRLQSVAIGTDGTLSFRCTTSSSFAPGASIIGVSSFRAYCNLSHSNGEPAVADAIEVEITPPNDEPFAAGFQCAITGVERDWGIIGAGVSGEPRATNADDYIRFSVRFEFFGVVTAVRLLLDVDPGTNPFLENYFMYEWRSNDLIAAVQSGEALPTTGLADAQAGAVLQGQVDAAYRDNYGSQQADTDYEGMAPPTSPTRDPQNGTTGIRPVNSRYARTRADGVVTVGSATTRQLQLGDNQWITLFCRVGDLTRVGTNVTRTLTQITNAAIIVQYDGADPADFPTMLLDASDCYITGGYGPDVSLSLPPYVYRYRYRNTVTGERSNPSPSMRAGVLPRRGRVNLLGVPADTNADVLDWFRFGGALARWTYVGSCPSSASTLNDDMEDGQIDGGETLPLGNFQPWPTADQPRQGTAVIAGTSVQLAGGDNFNPDWAADSGILINGRATALYRSPTSQTRLEVVDNVGSGTVEWSVPAGTLLATPLPALWGGTLNGAYFNFACGDPADPGLLHWTTGNNPDATELRNTLVVTSGSEPLMHGFFDDGVPYVFSTDRLFRIEPTFGDPIAPFRVYETSCTKGLWSRWAFCVVPNGGGVVFLAKDGIYHSVRGSEAVVLTDPDLKPLFPQEDSAFAETVRNLDPIDFSQPTKLKLTVVGEGIYFDYPTTTGGAGTLLFEIQTKRWTPDRYPFQVTARESAPGPQAIDHMIGASTGGLHQMDGEQLTDGADPIQWAVWTPWQRGEDGRATFQWGDAVLDMHPGASFSGIQVTPVIDNGNVALPSSTLGIGGTVRDTYTVEVNAGDGAWSRTFGLWIQGACQFCDVQRPVLYLWEPARIFKQTIIGLRATDYENLGYVGAKYVQGVVIRANTYGQDKLVYVQADGITQLSSVPLVLNHNGDIEKAYPLAASGWEPFTAQLVRLKGADAVDWHLLDWRWVWEPAPELASQWETQFTTFDYPGFLQVHDAIVAYEASQQVTLTVDYQDGPTASYLLPASGSGVYRRLRQILQAQKGKAVKFTWQSNSPFRLYKRDTSVRVQAWGAPGGYALQQPFGGPSRADGAGI